MRSLENTNFVEELKEQCLFSLEQAEGRYNRLDNVKAFSKEDGSSHLQGKGKQFILYIFITEGVLH